MNTSRIHELFLRSLCSEPTPAPVIDLAAARPVTDTEPEQPTRYSWQDVHFTALDQMCEYADRAALACITDLFNDPYKAALWLFGGQR